MSHTAAAVHDTVWKVYEPDDAQFPLSYHSHSCRYAHILTADMMSIMSEHYELELLFSKVFTLQEEEESQAHTSKGQDLVGEKISLF